MFWSKSNATGNRNEAIKEKRRKQTQNFRNGFSQSKEDRNEIMPNGNQRKM
jgi:hypothetical protein